MTNIEIYSPDGRLAAVNQHFKISEAIEKFHKYKIIRYQDGKTSTDSWYGASEPDMLTGISYGSDKFKDLKSDESKLYRLKRSVSFEDRESGQLLDVARAVSGARKCFRKVRFNEKVTDKLLDVYISIGVSSNVRSSDFEAAGIKIVKKIKALELGNKRCRVFIVVGVRFYSGMTCEQYLLIKDYQDVINESQIFFSVTDPSVLRRLLITLRHDYPNRVLAPSGYGAPTNFTLNNFADKRNKTVLDIKDFMYGGSEKAQTWEPAPEPEREVKEYRKPVEIPALPIPKIPKIPDSIRAESTAAYRNLYGREPTQLIG